MSLPSNYLDAFQEIARSGGFSQAVKVLNVSQSALSQRIKNLEDQLGLTLFLRTPTGVKLTEQGERLLRYCQTRDSLEEDLVADLNASNFFDIAGTVRIGCYSSVFRSVVVPALAPLLSEYPEVLCEFTCAKMDELPKLLQTSEVDMIILDQKLDQASLESTLLGQEQMVVIQPKQKTPRSDIFLDNDRHDVTTLDFFKSQNKVPRKRRRSYFDDCYGIIDGVKAGLGSAVMSKHLIKSDSGLKLAKGYKPFSVDVILYHYKQPAYSRLHQELVEALVMNSKKYL